jgi:hypothetical protein
MSGVLRKGASPYNVKSLARNKELRAVLEFVTANPGRTIRQIADHFGWSQPKGRNGVETLVAEDLLHVSGKIPTMITSFSYQYSVLDHDEDDLNRILPLAPPPDHMPAYRKRMKEAREATILRRAEAQTEGMTIVRRDPLIEMLMGSGRAPSLNFIDSLNGVQHAEPQTAIQAH